jgi:hypothetical protein
MPIYAVQVVRPSREAECFIDVPNPEAARTAGHKVADDVIDNFAELEFQIRVHPEPVEVSELEDDGTVWVEETNEVGAVRGKWVPVRELRAAIEAHPEPDEPAAPMPGQHDFFGGEVPVQ